MAKPTARAPVPARDMFEDPAAEAEALEEHGFSDPDDPARRFGEAFGEAIGAGFFGNPREANRRTRVPSNLSSAPVMAATGIEGADRWLVEIRNPDTAQADYGGEMPLSSTPLQVIRRFIDAMPRKEGDPPAELYFKALDKVGKKVSTSAEPDGVFTVPWYNPTLRTLLEEKEDREKAAKPSGDAVVLEFIKQQLDREREERQAEKAERAAAEARVREAQDALMKQRLDHAAAMQNDIGAAYSAVNATQATGFSSLMTAQERAAAEREKREEERIRREREEEDRRRQRERDAHEEERRRREEERKEERERIRAENQAALDRVRAEADARVKEMELRARLEEAKINAEVEKSRALALAETERIRAEREREDARRREEQERRDKLDAAERDRIREFTLAQEKIRSDALTAAERRLSEEAKRQEEHTRLMISLLRENQPGSGHKLGIVGELLETAGLTIPEVVEKAKEFMGGGGTSTAVAVIQGLGDIAKELIRRLPDIEEEEEEEDVEEPEAPPQAKPRRRRVVRQIPQQEEVPNVEARAGVPAVLDRLNEDEAPSAEVAIPLAERKAGREAVAAMVERLEGAQDWKAAIMEGRDVDVLVRYLTLVGLHSALDGYDVDAAKVGAALVELGLFETPPMDPKTGEK